MQIMEKMFSLSPVLVLLILIAHWTPTAAVLGWDLSELIPVSPASDTAVDSNNGNKTNSKDEVNLLISFNIIIEFFYF